MVAAKKTITLLILIAMAISCSKKDDPAIQQVCLFTKMTTTNGNDKSVYTYEYDAENKLTKTTIVYTGNSPGTSVIVYNYTAGAVSSVDGTYTPAGGSTSTSPRSTWTNDNGRVVKTVSGEYTTIFNYDANGNLSLVTETSSTSGRVITQALKWSGDLLSDRITGSTNSKPDLDLTVTFASYDGKTSYYS